MADAEVRARTVSALRQMAAVAAGFDVNVGFEFLGFPTCSVNTLRAAREIVDDVGDPRVGIVIDAFHFYAGGSRLEDLDGLPAGRLFIVHLDDAEPGDPARLGDAHRLWPGDGVIPLRPLIQRIEGLGYRGAYSLELFRPEYWAMDPVDVAAVGLEKMTRLFA
jgi:2-keto-myo-inositol isomerase